MCLSIFKSKPAPVVPVTPPSKSSAEIQKETEQDRMKLPLSLFGYQNTIFGGRLGSLGMPLGAQIKGVTLGI